MENPNSEYQLASRVAMSQLKEPRVMPIGTSDPVLGGTFIPPGPCIHNPLENTSVLNVKTAKMLKYGNK